MTLLASKRNEKKSNLQGIDAHAIHTCTVISASVKLTGNIVISSNCSAQIWKSPICMVIFACQLTGNIVIKYLT